jgi:hypothetical protein
MSQYSTGSEFAHIDIGPDLQVNEPVVVSVRKNLWQSMTDMISNNDEPFTLFRKAQKDLTTSAMLYNEASGSDRWLQLQVSLLCVDSAVMTNLEAY